MAKQAPISSVGSGFQSGTVFDANFAALNTALNNTLSRDGSTPNTMEADFDLNGNDVLNGGSASFTALSVNGSDPVSGAAASAAAALVSETNAATSEANAATSETNAATSETAAVAAAAAVEGVQDPDALAYLTAVGGATTATEIDNVDSRVKQLKAAGLWELLDVYCEDFGISAGAALTNLIDPTQVFTNNGATYTEGEGFAGNGSSAWIDTGLDSAALTNFTLNSAHLGVWLLDDQADNGRDIGFSTSANSYIISRAAAGSMQARMNDGTALAENVSVSSGHSGFNRSGASAREMYRDGVEIDSDTVAATSLGAGNLSILKGNTLFSPRTVWAFHAGGSLNSSQWSALYTIINDGRQDIIPSSMALLRRTAARSAFQSVGTVSGVATFDMDVATSVGVTLTEDVTTLTPVNWPVGVAQLRLVFTQDGTGGWSVTFPASWLPEGGGLDPTVSPTPGDVTEIIATSYDGGTTIRMAQGGVFSG